MPPPSINTQVVIDSTNKWIPLVIDTGGGPVDFTTSIAEDTYDDMVAVCVSVQGAIQAVGGGAIIPNATCSIIFTESIPGKVKFDFSVDLGGADTVEMDWLNNAHGSGGADDHIGTLLGFDDSADDGPIGSPWYFISDWQHQHGWYATRAIRSYGPLVYAAIGGKARKTLDRKYAKRLHIGFEERYEFRLENMAPELILWSKATGANTNRALVSDTVMALMMQSQWFRVREDQEVAGTYIDFYYDGPHDLMGKLTRDFPDAELYSLAMEFTKKVT